MAKSQFEVGLQNHKSLIEGWMNKYVPLTTPLQSALYSGDDTVGVGTTIIDTSDIFGAPVGIKAAEVLFRARWSVATVNSYMLIRPVGSSRYADILYAYSTDLQIKNSKIPCDSNGDFELTVANAPANQVLLEIWGFWI
jgi:hypothetical protein